jgi:hypothetical protein
MLASCARSERYALTVCTDNPRSERKWRKNAVTVGSLSTALFGFVAVVIVAGTPPELVGVFSLGVF